MSRVGVGTLDSKNSPKCGEKMKKNYELTESEARELVLEGLRMAATPIPKRTFSRTLVFSFGVSFLICFLTPIWKQSAVVSVDDARIRALFIVFPCLAILLLTFIYVMPPMVSKWAVRRIFSRGPSPALFGVRCLEISSGNISITNDVGSTSLQVGYITKIEEGAAGVHFFRDKQVVMSLPKKAFSKSEIESTLESERSTPPQLPNS